MKKLFENPGKKVKTLALVIFWILAASAVIGSIVFLFIDYDLFAISFGTLVGGLILAWVSGVVLYAFGELVEDVSIIRKKGSGTGEKKTETKALPEL